MFFNKNNNNVIKTFYFIRNINKKTDQSKFLISQF